MESTLKKLPYVAFLILVISVSYGASSQSIQENHEDQWEGFLVSGGSELKLVFKFTDGKCFLDVPGQAVVGYPATSFKQKDDSISVTFTGLFQAGFQGKKSIESIVGQWVQSGSIFPIILNRKKAYIRPQTPATPFPYRAEEIRYYNSDKTIKFAGTLTLPEKGTKLPVALLISGSGQQDRDETVFGHKPFLIIADYLTRNGIAVLRMDDRGMGGTTGKETLRTATSLDFAKDAALAIDYLKARPEIDPKKIGLIGHSEGGLIASIIASQQNDVAFVVSMAGVGVTGKELTLSQIEKALLRNMPQVTVDSILAFDERAIDIILHEKKDRLAEVIIMNECLGWVKRQDSLTQLYFGKEIQDGFRVYNLQRSSQRYQRMMLPWYRYFLAFDPQNFLPHIKAPFFALNGELDTQVLSDLNLHGFKQIFTTTGKKNYTTKSYPDLNHFFQHCKTGYIDEVEGIEETISSEVLRDMTVWIKKQF